MAHQQTVLRAAINADLKALGMRKDAFAEHLGITYETLRGYETGTRPLPDNRAADIAAKLSELLAAQGGASETARLLNDDQQRQVQHDMLVRETAPGDLLPRKTLDRPVRPIADALMRALPPSLRHHTDRALKFDGLRRRVDYLSETLAAEIKLVLAPADFTASTYQGAFHLRTLRDHLGDDPPRRHFVLVLEIPPDVQDLLGPQIRLARDDVTASGLLFRVADNASEVAHIIEELERGR